RLGGRSTASGERAIFSGTPTGRTVPVAVHGNRAMKGGQRPEKWQGTGCPPPRGCVGRCDLCAGRFDANLLRWGGPKQVSGWSIVAPTRSWTGCAGRRKI